MRTNSKYYWFKFMFDGELIQQSSKCTNKADARKIESAYRTQLALGKIGIKPPQKAPKFDEAAKDFLAWMRTEQSNDGTYNRYRFAVNTLKRYFGKTKTDKIKKTDVEKFIVWRKKQVVAKTGEIVSNDTVNRETLVLSKIFKRLIELEVLTANPALHIKKLKANNPVFHVITPSEEKAYLLASPQPLQDVATIMLETGMRCGEVYRIRRNELFLDKGYLKVTKGKTASSIRRVYLTSRASNILKYRLDKFKGKYLFPQDDIDGRPATKTIDKLHAKVMKDLDYDFRLYDCRHTFATRALENEMDLVTLKDILGHSSLRMVARYAHPSEARKAEAIRNMERGILKAKAV